MTKYIFLLPLLLPAALQAQDTIQTPPPVVIPSLPVTQTDTVFTTQVNGNFYVINRKNFSNGNYTENAELIGDLNAMVGYSQNFFLRAAYELSQSASVVLRANNEWQRAIQQDAAFQTAYNRSPLTDIQMQTDSTFLLDTWQLEVPGSSSTPIVFTRNAQNKLRATWGGGTAKAVYLVYVTMRINNFNAAGAMNFYQINNNLWSDANRQIFIRRIKAN